jgi:alanyl-tRNA synthetase
MEFWRMWRETFSESWQISSGKGRTKTVVFLASKREGKLSTLIALSKDLVGSLSAKELIKEVGKVLGGGGGGRDDLAQGGGTKPENFEKALELLKEKLR